MTTPTVTGLRCIAGPACRAAQTVDGDRLGAVTTEQDTLCDPCLTNITRCCRQLPRDWLMLHQYLGERRTAQGEFVKSSPTPGLPIDPTGEALAASIVELMELAAEMVSAALNAEHPDGRRNTAPDRVRDVAGEVEMGPPIEGSAAWYAEQSVKPSQDQTLSAFMRIVEPQIATLVQVESQDRLSWRGPRRCQTHTDAVETAEADLAAALEMPGHDTATPKDIHTFVRKQLRARRSKMPANLVRLLATDDVQERMHALQQAHAVGANCDECNGWDSDPRWGQASEPTSVSGLEVALKMCRLHGDIRAHLGHTKLRHHFDNVPCPAIDRRGIYCGARTVGQDDGSHWVDCTTCGTQWTESEYDLLVSMIVEDKEIELLRYLLAQAYWRLDRLQAGLDALADNPDISKAGAGAAVLEGLAQILADGPEGGHLRPEDRATVPALPETAEPKLGEKRWARDYGDPTPYKRPPRKRTRARKPVEHPIAASSLTLLTDIILGD